MAFISTGIFFENKVALNGQVLFIYVVNY